MDIGMLWYDDDTKRKLDEKVARAAQYYQTKYGVAPTVCYLHPSMLEDKTGIAGGVQLRPARTVLVNHFWIGLSEPVQVEVKSPTPRGRSAESKVRSSKF